MVKLIGEVLDQQIIDCRGQKSGKVDGIALEIRDGQPPRVAYLDIGARVRARRISARLERLVARLSDWLRGEPQKPFNLPWSAVDRVAISVNLNVAATDYSDFFLENWLRVHVIEKIPGNAHRKPQERNE